ncbi:MAG: hypothetical protein R3C61_07720 [Bacteroidia bacterium]
MNPPPESLKLLLWRVFSRLRTELDLPVGVDEYHLLLEALENGFGWENRDSLARLCETIWLKNPAHRGFLRKALDEAIRSQIAMIDIGEANKEKKESEVPVSETESKPREEKKQEPPKDKPQEKKEEPQKQPQTTSEARAQVETEAIGQVLDLNLPEMATLPDTGVPAGFLLDDSYLPLSLREMKQSWRFLRNPVKGGSSEEIDIHETVKNIARDGMFTELSFRPSTINKGHLLILVDHGGSMAAFDFLADQLVASARKGGGHEDAEVYYFRNCPQGYLYKNRSHVEGFARTRIWLKNRSEYTAVLIFSDAGAARGNFDSIRINQTMVFLRELKSYIGKIAWLNPVPSYRWEGTSATEIARQVPMYECISPKEAMLHAEAWRSGLDRSVQILKGKPQL